MAFKSQGSCSGSEESAGSEVKDARSMKRTYFCTYPTNIAAMKQLLSSKRSNVHP